MARLTKVLLVWYSPQRELTRTHKASGGWTEAAMDTLTSEFVRACSLDELKAKGRLVMHGRHPPILLVYDQGQVFALDNRCPHMGFPLERGSVADGILTCHWHHARFDLASGCTFDLWADDVPTCPVEVRDPGEVWVKPIFGHADPAAHWRRRLQEGLAHNLDLVIAKAVRGQLAAGVPAPEIIRQVALFGLQNRDGWGVGLTILTAFGNLLPVLPEEESSLALFHGARRVAADCAGQPPRRERAPLASQPDLAVLKRWLRHWTKVRHREAAERTLLTAITTRASPAALADLLVSAAADRVYADGGHLLDFINKACECLDLIGWEHAAAVLPSVVGQLVSAQGAEEATAWRHPIDLVALCEETTKELHALPASIDGGEPWSAHAVLAEALLGDEPNVTLDALKAAIRAGASPVDLSRALAYAAARRVAQFGTANEHSDWETAHHVFTYSNAVHQTLKRIAAGDALPTDAAEAARGILHGAMAVYLSRYLNVPPARLPDESDPRLNSLPQSSQDIRAALLDAFDRQRQVDAVGCLVARHLALGHLPDDLIATLAHALLREDAGFHACQMLEAGVRQFGEWADTRPGGHILIGVGRYLAAHSPTERAAFQTADIARRLLHGSELHQLP